MKKDSDSNEIWRVIFDPDLGAQRPELGMNELTERALLAFADAGSPEVAAYHENMIRAWYAPGQDPSTMTLEFRMCLHANARRMSAHVPKIAALLKELQAANDPA